jgi:hypothetical protein
MWTRKRTVVFVVVVVAVPVAIWLVLERNCPSSGIGLTSGQRHIHRLKNRTSFPQTSDFDSRVTLASLLQPGDDTNRWSTDRAARIQGQVIDVAYAGSEAANCFSPSRRDIHILIATRAGAPKSEQVVLEVTPKLSDWATQQGMDWSEEALRAQLIGHWCEFEGWLFFDVGHAEESENISPGRPSNWRATAWEVHPITKITVIR